MTPTIGRIVLVPADPATNGGADIAPAVVTRVYDDGRINVRVLLDSNTPALWRTSLALVEELPTTARYTDPAPVWAWPPRV